MRGRSYGDGVRELQQQLFERMATLTRNTIKLGEEAQHIIPGIRHERFPQQQLLNLTLQVVQLGLQTVHLLGSLLTLCEVTIQVGGQSLSMMKSQIF